MADANVINVMKNKVGFVARQAGTDPQFIPIDIRGLSSLFEVGQSYKVKLQFPTFDARVITPENDERKFASFECGLIHNGQQLPDKVSMGATEGYVLTLAYENGTITEATEFRMDVSETKTRRGTAIKIGTLYPMVNGAYVPLSSVIPGTRFASLVDALKNATQQTQQTTPPEPQQAQQPVGTTTGF